MNKGGEKMVVIGEKFPEVEVRQRME